MKIILEKKQLVVIRKKSKIQQRIKIFTEF